MIIEDEFLPFKGITKVGLNAEPSPDFHLYLEEKDIEVECSGAETRTEPET